MIFLDKIIIKITISEVKNFNIPIRVSINEYLDISKIYSTNKSSKFINGVLNSILNLKKN
jgi:N utilization substance protein B